MKDKGILDRLGEKIGYSFPGIVICGLPVVVLVWAAGWLVMPVFLSVFIYFIVSTGVLIERERRFRARHTMGLILSAVYFIFNCISLYFVNFSNAPRPVISVIVAAACYADCLLFGTLIMGLWAIHHKVAFDKDYCIILGCSIRKDGGLLPLLKARTHRAIRFAWDQEVATGRSVKFVPSGGQGSDEVISEGTAIEMYLLSHSAEGYEILTEKKSRNTYENLLFSRRLIDSVDPGAVSAFVTSDYHLLRSGIIARKLGTPMEGIASRTRWYFSANAAAREFIGIQRMFIRENLILGGISIAGAVILPPLLSL